MTKLSPSLPEGDRNGLGAISAALCDAPHSPHVILAVVDCKSVTTDMDTGEIRPTARILRVEAVSVDDHAQAEQLMRRSLERRHGAAMLPYDTEKELTDLFTEVGLDKDSPGTEGGADS